MRGDAVVEAGEAGTAACDGAADAVVGDAHVEGAVLAHRAQRDLRCRGMLDGVGEGFAGDEVRGCLHAWGDASDRRLDLDGYRRHPRQVLERGCESVVEPCGAHAGGDLAQVRDRGAHLADDLIQCGAEDARLARQRALQAAYPHAEGDEPLLGAVVDVAFEAPALLVACFHDSRSRGVHLGELKPDFDAEACDLDREGRGGEDAVEQVAPLEESRIMQEHAGRHAIAPNR